MHAMHVLKEKKLKISCRTNATNHHQRFELSFSCYQVYRWIATICACVCKRTKEKTFNLMKTIFGPNAFVISSSSKYSFYLITMSHILYILVYCDKNDKMTKFCTVWFRHLNLILLIQSRSHVFGLRFFYYSLHHDFFAVSAESKEMETINC